jgi:hypothetical protein
VPPEVDDDASPLDSGLACELDELLQKQQKEFKNL